MRDVGEAMDIVDGLTDEEVAQILEQLKKIQKTRKGTR